MRKLSLISACLILSIQGAFAARFIHPVTGWERHRSDTYDTFYEDVVGPLGKSPDERKPHPCTSTHYDPKNCYDKTGSLPIERHCGYNDQCSIGGNNHRHAAYDYDRTKHNGHWQNGKEFMQYGDGAYHGSDDDVFASNDGTIVKILYNGSGDENFGNTIIIKHKNLVGCTEEFCPNKIIYTQYSHLSDMCGSRRFGHGLYVGKPVKQRDIIGCIGGTGNGKKSYWLDHLHFEFKTWGGSAHKSPTCGNVYGYPPKGRLEECGYRDPGLFLSSNSTISVGPLPETEMYTFDVCEKKEEESSRLERILDFLFNRVSAECGVYRRIPGQLAINNDTGTAVFRAVDPTHLSLPIEVSLNDVLEAPTSSGGTGNQLPPEDEWVDYDHDVGLKYVELCKDKDKGCKGSMEVSLQDLPRWDIRAKLKRKGKKWKDVKVKYYCSGDKNFKPNGDKYLGKKKKKLTDSEFADKKKESVYLKDADLSKCIKEEGTYYLYVVVHYEGGKNKSTRKDSKEHVRIEVSNGGATMGAAGKGKEPVWMIPIRELILNQNK